MNAESVSALPAWPYPRWIAHRGAGKLAPENTLAAFRQGAQHGYRMFECDVKLSVDGVPFLLHDATLGRTTNASNKPLALVECAQAAIKNVAVQLRLQRQQLNQNGRCSGTRRGPRSRGSGTWRCRAR